MEKKRQLKNVTLVALTSTNINQTIKALKYSMREIEYAEVLLISHKKPFWLPKGITYKYTTEMTNIDGFNYKMVYELYKYINTDYALIVHADGFVVNPDSWKEEFLEYDYIGAPWPIPPETDKISYRDEDGTLYRVGNSVSIRSKRLLELPSKINMPWEKFHGWYNEDGFICVNRRKVFEQHGMKYAPVELAVHFSQETMIPECEGVTPFCFHKWNGKNSVYPRFSKIPFINI